MALRTVLTLGDEALRKESRPVTEFGSHLHALLDDMAETMYKSDGAGLAAPQVGILRRIVVIDVGEGLIELVNPVIVGQEGEELAREGCLSLPGRQFAVRRPLSVTVAAQDRNGAPITAEGRDLLARALCHEIDHLNGVLCLDVADAEFKPT